MEKQLTQELWVDSFLSNLFIPFKSEFMIAALNAFGKAGYDAYALALTAIFAAFVVNFYAGKLLVTRITPWVLKQKSFVKTMPKVHRFCWVLLFFSWVSVFGPFFVFVAGVFQAPAGKTIAIALLAKAVFLAHYLGYFSVSV